MTSLRQSNPVGCYCADRRHQSCQYGIGDFGRSPIFVRLSDKSLLASALLIGVPERILQWRIERLCADPIRRLRGLTELSRDEMRLAGYPNDMAPIDVCTGAE